MFTVYCRHAHSDWNSTAAFIYFIARSTIMLTWTYIIVLDIFFYYIHIIEIPTNKGANSYKIKKIDNRELLVLKNI